MYLFTERLLGRLIALVAVAVMLTRTDMQLLALRAMFDLPFYLMVFGAALLELRRPRCGWPVLVAARARRAATAGGVAARRRLLALPRAGDAAPACSSATRCSSPPRRCCGWRADLIVTGEPLYSLTSTREVSGEFGRNRGLFEAITLIPQYSGGNDRIVTVGVGGLGLLLAVYILRRRAALPLALGGLGVLTFLIIAAAGLSVIPRYLTIPSLLLSLCVAVALAGWTLVEEQRTRRVAIGIAVVSVLVAGLARAVLRPRLREARASRRRSSRPSTRGSSEMLDAPRPSRRCSPAARSPSRRTRRSR